MVHIYHDLCHRHVGGFRQKPTDMPYTYQRLAPVFTAIAAGDVPARYFSLLEHRKAPDVGSTLAHR